MSGRVDLGDDLTEMRFRHLLVAEDASAASRVGVAAGAQLARRIGARLTVLHVRHEPSWMRSAGLGAMYMSASVAAEVTRTLDTLEELARSTAAEVLSGAGVCWDFQVRQGRPGREIVGAVEELDADLVLIGSDRHGRLHSLLRGSTTAYVTARSRAPVMVVPPRAERRRRPVARRGAAEHPALRVLSS